MNILKTCLFRLTAVWQKNGSRPGKPLRRTIVRDFPDAAGMENNYLHECKLFVPDAPIPDTITALQKTVLAGIRPVKEFYQKKLFFRWLADNKQLFGREPYLVGEDVSSFSLQFNGIIKNISCCFLEQGDIMIMVNYRNKFFDIVTDFDLYEEQTPDGRFLCTLCDKNPDNTNKNALVYEIRDELWIKHSFEPLAQWTRKMFTDDALLCLCRYGSTTAAFIEFGEELEKLRKREKIYKEIPVINIDVNYEKSVDL